MDVNDKAEIRGEIAGRLKRGELALLLGAGFSVNNESKMGQLPDGDGLRDLILAKCGAVAGSKTTLKDAYAYGRRKIDNFDEFLASIFTVMSAAGWQERIFKYPWSRIYTTNIDNVLAVAHDQARNKGGLGGDYRFINYCDPGVLEESLGRIPVVSIHGSCQDFSKGFIFSGIEYGQVAIKSLDWHRELASRILSGGLVVVGNQLDESDIDASIAMREQNYGVGPRGGDNHRNWIVMPNPDSIKAENYRAAGFYVIDATGEQFFEEVFSAVPPTTVAEAVAEKFPSVRKLIANREAATWLKAAFSPVLLEMDEARAERGLLKSFISGSEPEWLYIVHDAHARTTRSELIVDRIGSLMHANAVGVAALHVVGPSGSGKTTEIMVAISQLIAQFPSTYEFKQGSGIDPDLLLNVICNVKEKSIFVFYNSYEYYYAINYVLEKASSRQVPFSLFVLEDRVSDYKSNRHQLRHGAATELLEVPNLSKEDAISLVRKMSDLGLRYDQFSDLGESKRVDILINKEKGYGGDLLSALFSITSSQSFEDKIYTEFFAAKSKEGKAILEVVSIITSRGLPAPIGYISGMLGISVAEVLKRLDSELAGVLFLDVKSNNLRCRHRVVADYYFGSCIVGHGSRSVILDVLTFLSRQFTVQDIRYHPLPYRIYKELISFDFLGGRYFPEATRDSDAEYIYHESQKLFGEDGIFWLQYGRFYRKTSRLREAIDCYRTGLAIFDSFQAKHALGQSLLELYIDEGCAEDELYQEGVKYLDAERLARGDKDPYPTCTLIEVLYRVTEKNPDNADADTRLRLNIAYAMKHFPKDDYAKRLISKRFRKSGGRNS